MTVIVVPRVACSRPLLKSLHWKIYACIKRVCGGALIWRRRCATNDRWYAAVRPPSGANTLSCRWQQQLSDEADDRPDPAASVWLQLKSLIPGRLLRGTCASWMLITPIRAIFSLDLRGRRTVCYRLRVAAVCWLANGLPMSRRKLTSRLLTVA